MNLDIINRINYEGCEVCVILIVMFTLPEYVNHESPIFNEEAFKCAKAVLTGGFKGLKNITDTILHPLDNYVYPIYDLVCDAAIISAPYFNHPGNVDEPDFTFINRIVESNPQIYHDASRRMLEKANTMKSGCIELAKSPISAKIESASEMMTSILVPGCFIKGVKMIKNLHELGTVNPPKFHNVRNDKPRLTPKSLSIDEVRRLKLEGLFYVYTEDKKLLICRYEHAVSPSKILDVYHSELAQLKPVYAAGELMIKDGKIVNINNLSGHYLPGGKDLKKLTEKALIKNGYPEAAGKMRHQKSFDNYATKASITHDKLRTFKIPLIPLADNIDDTDSVDRVDSVDINKKTDQMSDKNNANKTNDAKEACDIIDDGSFSHSGHVEKRLYVLVNKIKQINTLSEGVISDDAREKLLDLSDALYGFGSIGLNLSGITKGLKTHTHQRTWNNVASVSSNMIFLAHNISTIASGSMLSLAGIASGFGVLLGSMSILSTLFGDNSPDVGDALASMGEILANITHSIHNLHSAMIEGFKYIERLINSGNYSILARLDKINSQCNRIELICCGSFKELHGKDLINIADAIEKCINGEIMLNNADKNDLILKLSTWIDYHSKSGIQTSTLKKIYDPSSVNDVQCVSKYIEILNSDDFDIFANFPLFLIMLNVIYPLTEIENIPNMVIFESSCKLYMKAVQHFKFTGNSIPLLQRSRETFENILAIITKLANNSDDIEDCLLRQHEYYRFCAGRDLSKLKGDISSGSSLPLIKCLLPGHNTEKLHFNLNQMEFRRLIALKLSKFAGFNISSRWNESKEQMLNRSCAEYCSIIANSSDYSDIYERLMLGGDVNEWNSCRQLIHEISCSVSVSSCKKMHLLLKCPEIELSNPIKYDRCDTWGANVRPIQYMLNNGLFHYAVLFCAAGGDISDRLPSYNYAPDTYLTDFYNAQVWASGGSWMCELEILLVKEMNKPLSSINKRDLRAAYNYCKQIEAGFQATSAELGKLNHKCVLMLASIIDDVKPLKLFENHQNFDYNVNLGIPEFNALSLAIHCDSISVYSYLSSRIQSNFEKLREKEQKIIMEIANNPIPSRGNRINDSELMKFVKNNIDYLDMSISSINITPRKPNSVDNVSILLRLSETYVDSLPCELKTITIEYIKNLRELTMNDKAFMNNKEEIASKLNILDAIFSMNTAYKLSDNVRNVIRELRD